MIMIRTRGRWHTTWSANDSRLAGPSHAISSLQGSKVVVLYLSLVVARFLQAKPFAPAGHYIGTSHNFYRLLYVAGAVAEHLQVTIRMNDDGTTGSSQSQLKQNDVESLIIFSLWRLPYLYVELGEMRSCPR